MNVPYKIENDPKYKEYLKDREERLSESTIIRYAKELRKFAKATGKTLEEIITEAKDEQDIIEEIIISEKTEGNTTKTRKKVKEYDVNNPNSAIKRYISIYEDYCKDKGNKNTTINNGMIIIKTFLNHFNVKFPDWERLEDDSDEWNLLEKEDFNFILKDCTLIHKALITFMLSSGIRVGDCLRLTIGDFMEATKEYHNYVEVDDFIDNAPDDMMGFWGFEPHKTKKYDIRCKTFNSAESSNYIMQSLRRIKNEFLPKKNKTLDKKIKMRKNDSLFGSRNKNYKEPITQKSISSQYALKNHKLQEWKILKLKEDIDNGKISEEDFEKEMEKLPKFHAHACRKYFETTIANNCGDLRLCTLMEGHASPVKTDKSYIKKDRDAVKEVYLKAHDDLTLSKTETKIISDKETERLNAEIESLKAENAKIREEKDQEISNLEQKHQKEIDDLKSSVGNMQKQMDDIKHVKTRSNIEKIISDYFDDNYKEDILKQEENLSNGRKKCNILSKLAYGIAMEEESNFRDDDDYLNSLIQRAIVKYTLDPSISERYKLTSDEVKFVAKYTPLTMEIVELIKSNNVLWDMVKDDLIKLNNLIVYVLKNNVDNIDNLTDEDKDDIVQEVLMEYLTVD